MERDGRLMRAVVFVVVVGVFLAAGLVIGFAVTPTPTEPPEFAVFDPAETVPERTQASGEVDIDPQPVSGTVLIDASHANRIDQEDIEPLVSGILQTGWDVRFYTGAPDLDAALNETDTFVVIAPMLPYAEGDADAVREFVDDGGRLLMANDPTHFVVEPFGAERETNRMNHLAKAFDIQYGPGYLFNLEENDGNFQHIYVAGADGGTLADVDAVAHLATWIVAADGEPFLVAQPEAERSTTDQVDAFPVAVVDGDVMAIGDTSFFRPRTYNVADNEQVLEEIILFIVGE